MGKKEKGRIGANPLDKDKRDIIGGPEPTGEAGDMNVEGESPRAIAEDLKNKRRVLFVNDRIYNAVKGRAEKEGTSPSKIVRAALVEYLGL